MTGNHIEGMVSPETGVFTTGQTGVPVSGQDLFIGEKGDCGLACQA